MDSLFHQTVNSWDLLERELRPPASLLSTILPLIIITLHLEMEIFKSFFWLRINSFCSTNLQNLTLKSIPFLNPVWLISAHSENTPFHCFFCIPWDLLSIDTFQYNATNVFKSPSHKWTEYTFIYSYKNIYQTCLVYQAFFKVLGTENGSKTDKMLLLMELAWVSH